MRGSGVLVFSSHFIAGTEWPCLMLMFYAIVYAQQNTKASASCQGLLFFLRGTFAVLPIPLVLFLEFVVKP